MDADHDSKNAPAWFRGAALIALGVVLGTIAFALFCYALGLNFSDEGWAENQNAWHTNRPALVGSFIGFAIAIPIFWIGFVQTTRTKSAGD